MQKLSEVHETALRLTTAPFEGSVSEVDHPSHRSSAEHRRDVILSATLIADRHAVREDTHDTPVRSLCARA